MAEKEEAKKPVVEMSVWFIILLVVLIISTILVIRVNDEKAELATQLEESQKRVTQLEESRRDLLAGLQDVASKVSSNGGNYSPNQVVELFSEKLAEAGLNVTVDENLTITPVVTEVDSGEVEQVVE